MCFNCRNVHPSVWFRYVDDTFTLFDNKNTATQFLHYLNNCHANIKFTVEFEENSTIPFLDILIKRHSHTFSTSIYRKKTFTGLYTKWDSFTPRKYKVNIIRTLTFRCFRICSSPLLRSCLDELRKLLLQNGHLSFCYYQLQHQWCFEQTEQTAKQTEKSNHHSFWLHWS